MGEKLPYMPIWVYDIETDEACMMLDAAGFGLYMRLLFRQWIEGSIPADLSQIARLLREPDETVRLSLGFIESKFPLCSDGRRRNDRCTQERDACESKASKSRANGRKGGRPRSLKSDHTDSSDSPEITQPLTQNEPTGPTPAYGSGSGSGSGFGSSEEEKESTNFQADLAGLNRLIGLWKPQKRGGRVKAARLLADALGRLAGPEGAKDPWQRLAAQMRGYTASDQGRSMYCKNLSTWLEEGCYLQNPLEWANDSDQKGSGPALSRADIERKLAAARQNLSLVPPEADGDDDRAKLQRVVKIWEQRLAEHQGDDQ